MSFLNRLLGIEPDPRAALRPLWHRVVEISRRPAWYADAGVADTVQGRIDMIVAVLAIVLLRMERDAALAAPAALLTELFVEDMDGQLRESGVGDLMVGKHIGRLMGVLGGRIGALRDGLAEAGAQPDAEGEPDAEVEGDELARAVERNFALREGADPHRLAAMLRSLHGSIDGLPAADLLEGRIPA